MSIEKEDSLSMYDDPLGEVPEVPIGQFSHVDGNGHKRPDGEVAEVQQVASDVGAEVIPKPNGADDTTVIKHRAWLWVGGAVGAGITVLGLGTAFAIEHHRRKSRKNR